MRRIRRLPLEEPEQADLDRRQAELDATVESGAANIQQIWKAARQSTILQGVLSVLHAMAGPRRRCMYCGDSHGTDIEHFRPKSRYPRYVFRWPNLLLCCTECGRFKGDRFPMLGELPLLIDPTADNPWEFLDFDPQTGNITARFDPTTNDWIAKGAATVATLHLDRREALASGLRDTHQQLVSLVETAVRDGVADFSVFMNRLSTVDRYGLLGWGFTGNGQVSPPFDALRLGNPELWNACCRTITLAD